MQSNKKITRSSGMTLIEVLVALTIASFVFSSLLQMAFDSLKRAKNLELQDKMRNYATEAVQVVYNTKDTNWDASFGEPPLPAVAIMPPSPNGAAINSAQITLGYLDVLTNPDGKPILKTLGFDVCHFNEDLGILEGNDCELTSASEPITNTNKKLFGRIIRRLDDDQVTLTGERDTINDATLEVIVACLESRCSGTDFKPFKLNFQIYRTSGP